MSSRAEQRPWLIVNTAFNRAGGQERANYELACYVKELGRPMTLVAHDCASELREAANVRVIVVPKPAGSTFLGERALEAAAMREYRSTRAANPVFLANGGNCPSANVNWVHFVHAAWDGALANAPLIAHTFQTVKKRDARRRERVAFQNADCIIANSDRTREELVRLLQVPPSKVTRIWFGAEEVTGEERTRASVTGTLLFVGALGWDCRKGLDIALEALTLLTRERSLQLRLCVAGAGQDLAARRMVAKLGLGGRVSFLSFVDDMSALYREADVLISPTRYEPYGLAVQEAVMFGVPPLVSASAGIVPRLGCLAEPFIVRSDAPAVWAQRIQEVFAAYGVVRAQLAEVRQELARRPWRAFAAEFVSTVEGPWPEGAEKQEERTPQRNSR